MSRLRIPAGGSRPRVRHVVLGLVAIVAGGCTQATAPPQATPTPQFSSGLTPLIGFSPPPTGPDAPPCQYPPETEPMEWLPDDLPLPEGTYPHRELEDLYGYKRGLFVVPTTLDVFTRFVLERWPAAGWTLGRGDSEPGEVEDQFAKPPAVGAFKTQSVYCRPGYSMMILIYAEDSSQVGEDPNTQSGSPLPGTSPTP